MKVKIIEDELYPYFYEAGKDCTIENDRVVYQALDREPKADFEIEMTESEYEEWSNCMRQFHKWRMIIDARQHGQAQELINILENAKSNAK